MVADGLFIGCLLAVDINMNHRSYYYFNPVVKIVVALLVIILSFGWGSYLGKQNEARKNKDSVDGAVREAMAEIFGKVSANNLQGRIVSVSADKKSIVVEIPSVFGFPLPKSYQDKILTLPASVEIIMAEQKTAQEFEKELSSSKKKSGSFGFVPPSPVVNKAISVDELKAGDQISFIVADAGKNILDNFYDVNKIVVSSARI